MDRSRALGGAAVGLVFTVLVTAVLVPVRADVRPTTPALVLVLPVGFSAIVGGRWPALLTAVVAASAYNLGFIQPYGTMKVDHPDDVVVLLVFIAVAVLTGALVARASERSRAAEKRASDIEALNHRIEQVMQERGRLAEEANRAQVLERVDEQRSALLQSVSHDLRTPLAAIKAVASDLRDGATYDEDLRATLLDSVVAETERLDRLVANLLSMSRIEAGALAPDRQVVDVEELLRDRVRRLARLFDHVRLQVDVASDLPLVDGDYTQLEQVVTNLLENAARYAPAKSTVTVAARSPGPDAVEITVADEGIGVPPHESRRIFEPFHRGEGSRSSGVGLAICRAVVEAHGGTIDVLRTPGGGATFVTRLPARHG